MSDVSRETPALKDLEALLAGPGIERGLIGPREADRLWERHILNCAVVAEDRELVPEQATVVDVGSGAGLPGIVWALVRPDLRVTLVESLQRRTRFLDELVQELGLGERVTVIRERAENVAPGAWQIATARAVAPLPRLLPWLAPLATDSVLALKGRSAADEVAEAAAVARGLDLAPAEILAVGSGVIDPPTTVVRYQRLSAH